MEKKVNQFQQCTVTDDCDEQNNCSSESKNNFIENLQSNLTVFSSSCSVKVCGMHNGESQECFLDHVNLKIPIEERPAEISENQNRIENSLIDFSPSLEKNNTLNQSTKLIIKQEIKLENLDESEVCNSTVEDASVLRNTAEQNSEQNNKALENVSFVLSNIPRAENATLYSISLKNLSAIDGNEKEEIQSVTDSSGVPEYSGISSETNSEPNTSHSCNNPLLMSSISETIIPVSAKVAFKETEIIEKESMGFDKVKVLQNASNSWNNCISSDISSQSISADKQLQDPERSLSSNLIFRCRSPEKATSEMKFNAQLNSSECSKHLFKRPCLNVPFSMSDVTACLEYINSTYSFKNENKLFNTRKDKFTKKSIYVIERNQQMLGNKTSEKSFENYADTKYKSKKSADSFYSPQKYTGMDKIPSYIDTCGLSINCSNSSVSSEENSISNSSSIKSNEKINVSDSAPVVCQDFISSLKKKDLPQFPKAGRDERMSCDQLRKIINNALKFHEGCNLNSTPSSSVKNLTSTGIINTLNSSSIPSSDSFPKTGETKDRIKSNLIVNDVEGRSKSSEDITIPSDFSKSAVHGFQAENLRNVISGHSAPLKVSDHSETCECTEYPESKKRKYADVIEKMEILKKVKSENFRDDCGDLNIQSATGKEAQDVQNTTEKKSPKVTNIIVGINDTAENISLLFGNDGERNMVTNSYPNVGSSYNTRNAFEKQIVSDINEKLKSVSGVQPDCSLRKTQISNVKRKLTPVDYMNSFTGNSENLRLTPTKYFKKEPTQILADPCLQQNVIRVPCISKNISEKTESFFELPSSFASIRPHIPTTETSLLKNKMFITVSKNESSRIVSCIPPTSSNPNSIFNASGNKDTFLSLPHISTEEQEKLVHQPSQLKSPASALENFASENSNKTVIVNSTKAQALSSTASFRITSNTLEQKGVLHSKETFRLGEQSTGEPLKQTGYELDHYSEEILCLDIFPGRRGNAALTKRWYKNLGSKFVPTNDVLSLLLEWNACWLQIQKKTKLCPPICDKYGKVRNNYESVKDYYNTYFPLYLLSIWLKIYNSWEVCLNATHYKVRFESYVERPNYVKITCSSTLTSAEFRDFPTEEGIILVTVTKCDGKEEKLFGYMSNWTDDSPPPHYNQGPLNKTDFRKISISFRTAEKLNIAPKEYVTIQKLCNIRVLLKQNDALISLKASEMKNLVLSPKDHASEINIITLPGTSNIIEMFSRIHEIVDCIISPEKKIALVAAPSSVDRVNVIVELVRKLEKSQSTVLICLKEKEVFVRLASLLINELCKLVIAVKASEIEMPERLEKYTLGELSKAKISDKCTPENASTEVLKNCSVILTVLSCIYFTNVGTDFPASNLTCIIDDANIFSETETILPLSYNLKNLVLFGDLRKQAALHPFLQKYGFQKSFYNRLYTVKSIL